MVFGVGVTAENNELEESLGCKGMYGIDEEALRVFEIVIIEQVREGISDHIVVRLHPMKLAKAAQKAGDVDSFWASDSENVSAKGGNQSNLSSLQGLKSIDAVQAVREHFIAKLARMWMLGMNEFEEESRSMYDWR
ncbi:Acyl transferase/acyl hydrolase/lysophospholipase [Penicillium robsamsonii]|uniref:Acyl transferase/acyl hydrolase/lysophospholipase n=1 Tax=Penicillium robsamsonii TaxID=1792511 RepID=UPI002546E070|nr:Acyl transferase/acyl hydrolase/lysophospholipase [Penicillium robsamsonii]KAJ5824338.1 Acyl transferase/acyl hydrolase/lysophospholipase [Penicillium robsamsonii]